MHRGAFLVPLAALTGCNAVFLGEDFHTDALPLRTVSAWPVVEAEEDPATGERRTQVLAGLVSHHEEPALGTEQDAAFPFFWHAREGDATRTRVPPFYFHDADANGASTTAWPFFGSYARDGGRRVSLVSELVSVGHDEAGGAVDVSAPRGLVEYHRSAEGTDLWSLGYKAASLARWSSDANGGESHLLPLVWHSEDRATDTSTTVAAPGVIYHRHGEDSHLSLLGVIAAREREGATTRGHVLGWGPAALASWREDGQGASAHAFPLYWHGRDADSDWTVLFPGYFHFANQRDGTARTVVFPLVHASHTAVSERLDVLWPLFHSGHDGAHDEWHSLFYAARYTRDAPDVHDFRVLYKLFRRRQDGTRVETALNPLVTVTGDEALGYRSVSVLFGLYQYERRHADTSHRLLWLFRV